MRFRKLKKLSKLRMLQGPQSFLPKVMKAVKTARERKTFSWQAAYK